jgi:hypothetical protein
LGRDTISRLCCQRLEAVPVADRIPPFLTVEEASRLLKIGRTKAYDLTKEWRATGGRSGLPVVDLGDVLRVPGPAIEQMLGIGLGALRPTAVSPTGKQINPVGKQINPTANSGAPGATPEPPERPTELPAGEPPASPAVDSDAEAPAPSVAAARTPRQRRRHTNQLPLSRQPRANHPPMNPALLPPTPQRPTDICHPFGKALPGAAAFRWETRS